MTLLLLLSGPAGTRRPRARLWRASRPFHPGCSLPNLPLPTRPPSCCLNVNLNLSLVVAPVSLGCRATGFSPLAAAGGRLKVGTKQLSLGAGPVNQSFTTGTDSPAVPAHCNDSRLAHTSFTGRENKQKLTNSQMGNIHKQPHRNVFFKSRMKDETKNSKRSKHQSEEQFRVYTIRWSGNKQNI